jgi:membrane protease YdiL (CAAX protease family)
VYLRLTGRSLRDYNLSFNGLTAHLGVYAALCGAVLLCVAAVSFLPDFQRIYPFYPLADRSWLDLLLWELGYAAQFVALEFFFRAFLLEGLRRCMGPGAILVMLLPYCMLHFPKTGLETAGSIIAGLVLGMMAMRWRSIWGGVLVHTTIAVSMDVASLLQQDRLPPPGWLP